MNSTEDKTITEIFQELVVSAGRELARNGKTLFPRGPDPSASSYFIDREQTPPSKQVFELEVESFEDKMCALWESQGLRELQRVMPPLAALASDLREGAEQDESVSPFIYVMF